MHKDTLKNLGLILLLGVTVFSMVRYVSELKARFRLQDSLTQTQDEAARLSQQRQNLLQELGKEQEFNQQLVVRSKKLKAYSRASATRMKRFFRDSAITQNELEDISAKFSILKAENRALIDRHKRSYLQNEQLKFKLGSVAELKKAIRELRAQRFQHPDLEIGGNQGFLIKDGRSTSEKIKIEVISAPNKALRGSSGETSVKIITAQSDTPNRANTTKE